MSIAATARHFDTCTCVCVYLCSAARTANSCFYNLNVRLLSLRAIYAFILIYFLFLHYILTNAHMLASLNLSFYFSFQSMYLFTVRASKRSKWLNWKQRTFLFDNEISNNNNNNNNIEHSTRRPFFARCVGVHCAEKLKCENFIYIACIQNYNFVLLLFLFFLSLSLSLAVF